MSHFTVGVISRSKRSYEDLLEPYSENLEVEPYVAETRAEIIAAARRNYQNILETYPGKILGLQAEGKDTKYYEDRLTEANMYKDSTDAVVYKVNREEDSKYNRKGDRLTTYNPDSKWDWYSVGGRWKGSLLVKDTITDILDGEPGVFGGEPSDAPAGYKWVDSAMIKDIDFKKMSEISDTYKKALRFWELHVEEQPLNAGETKPTPIYNKDYYINRYGDKETYAKGEASFSTYALLVEDKGWIAPGEMGWWGMDSSTGDSEREYQKTLESILNDPNNQDKYLTIVDCHI